MKSPESTEQAQEILSEYHFDYSKAKPNRFATVQPKTQVTVTLEPDVAQIFTTSEAVNNVLRAILAALPNSQLYGRV
ncbi:MAG: hypothetical protein DRQ57_17365 [Gammaproteobacteria bacterium]|nr:MAG: hypothetical protein DRQ57_17365 [Gammaproteobacteria bacterium]